MSTGTMLFNPFTGKPRDPRDIASDPRGVLVWDGEEPLLAAPLPSTASAPPAVEPASAKQIKLRELADRIDHERLYSRPALEHRDWPQDKRDRMDAGVNLRRYAELLEPNRWLIFPPTGPVRFSSSTLDGVVEMAKRDEERKAAAPTAVRKEMEG